MATWRHKYHIVFCPKYRYRILKEAMVEYAQQQVYQLYKQKELVVVLELNVLPDHVYLVVEIVPKYAVSVLLSLARVETFQSNIQWIGTGVDPF